MTKLDELLCCINNETIYVQMHNYPDQDAIASAMGLQFLLQARGKKAIIAYHGIIDKDNTLKMIELLHIQLFMIDQLNITPDDEIIIVDSQKGNLNLHDMRGSVIACIDHHKIQNTDQYRFYDIRSEVGACASIIASYFFENNIPISKNIATALVYALQIDTSHMTRSVSHLDIDMFCHLYKLANTQKLRKFETNSLKQSDLSNYQAAIQNLTIHNDCIGIADIGNNCSDAIIGSVCDFFLTLSELEFIMIYSYRDGGLKFSLRSTNDALDASTIIRDALYELGDGGGHSDMAAGFLPNIPTEEEAKTLARLIEGRVLSLINRYIVHTHHKL